VVALADVRTHGLGQLVVVGKRLDLTDESALGLLGRRDARLQAGDALGVLGVGAGRRLAEWEFSSAARPSPNM
jgi:hypothetical protein